MKNEKMQAVVEKAKMVFSHAGKIVIILVAMALGFALGNFYYRLNQKDEEKAPMDLKLVHRLKQTSVAINERNELLVIDRQTGTYEIYEDSVGKVIFRLYASQMVSNASE